MLPRLAGLLFLALLLASCFGSGNSDRAVVRLRLDPTATPTPPGPTATPAPPPELVLSSDQVVQGGAILASVTGAVTIGRATFLDRSYDLVEGERSKFTFIGIDTDDPPGEYPLRVDFTLASGSTGSLTQPITIGATAWTVEAIDFEDEKAPLLDPAVAAAEENLLASIYGEVTAAKLWDGLWRYPVPGSLTARFGEQRAINGGAPAGHHSGSDLGGETGEPVAAANSGVVVLARALDVRGNMVIIDHGGGLFSGYAHLSEINVAEGQEVASGDTVGLVGSTGLTTGPHLHWEMAVHGVRVDALRFADGTNGF